MKQLKRTFFFLFYLLAGIIVGTMLASLCARVPFLSFLAYQGAIGFAAQNPACLDLIVVKLYFGFSVSVSVAQILCIGFAMFLYNHSRNR